MLRLGKELLQLFDVNGEYRATVLAPRRPILCLNGVFYLAGGNTDYHEKPMHEVTARYVVDQPHRRSDAPAQMGASHEH